MRHVHTRRYVVSAERRAEPQGAQSQTVCAQVHGVRAKAAVVNVVVVVVVVVGAGGVGGGAAAAAVEGWVCVARGRERQVEQRRRCRFGSVDAEGGLMMQFCGAGDEGCVSGVVRRGGRGGVRGRGGGCLPCTRRCRTAGTRLPCLERTRRPCHSSFGGSW